VLQPFGSPEVKDGPTKTPRDVGSKVPLAKMRMFSVQLPVKSPVTVEPVAAVSGLQMLFSPIMAVDEMPVSCFGTSGTLVLHVGGQYEYYE
jgi:hypothetical protein